ncbi:altered inheritance of mitochondria protein 3 [Copidosoma floridanum]|uniref:altered inheritance of mitochondria protein 3 n=1 Tax=Copidosoma floridanum TaxID=29053 RepID=UPI0006C9B334|nr:altered inheritance of mitochondria protein 3 [Copidosoma floridanum]
MQLFGGTIVVVLVVVLVVEAQDSDKQLQEAALGLQSCVDGFVVHRDKIIRTEDSREMGAKYLTEFDVESRVECMRACCETPHCDVFIFEEKKPGSCYLFHCGPPQDFKCKFTSHANYSSAVLTDYNPQSAIAQEEEIRRNQQEHELKSLRKLEPPPQPQSAKEYRYFTNPPPPTSTTPATTTSTTTTTQAPIKAPKCSRNQFECRSGEDCIAIYNVCDGIPQCADGSDEAAELGCPVERSTPAPPPAPATPKPYIPMLPDVIRYQQMIQQQHPQYPMMYPNGRVMDPSSNKGWPMPNPNSMAGAQEMSYNGREYPAPVHQHHQQQPAAEESGIGVNPPAGMGQMQIPDGYQWNSGYNTGPIYEPQQPQPGVAGSAPAALDVIHAPNAPPPAYEQEQMSRIFNHKGPGIRLENMEPSNGVYGQDPNRVYAPYYAHMMHRNMEQQPQMPIPTPAPPQEQPNAAGLQKHHTTSTTSPPCDPLEKQDDTGGAKSSDKKGDSGVAQKKLHAAVGKAKGDNDSPEMQEDKPMPASVVKSDIHKVHELEVRMQDAHLQQHGLAIAEHVRHHGPNIEELEISRPKGAVISLALGLSITAIMAVLIACRMRVVKRRGRGRGHDSFSHDADYLVNGMYL